MSLSNENGFVDKYYDVQLVPHWITQACEESLLQDPEPTPEELMLCKERIDHLWKWSAEARGKDRIGLYALVEAMDEEEEGEFEALAVLKVVLWGKVQTQAAKYRISKVKGLLRKELLELASDASIAARVSRCSKNDSDALLHEYLVSVSEGINYLIRAGYSLGRLDELREQLREYLIEATELCQFHHVRAWRMYSPQYLIVSWEGGYSIYTYYPFHDMAKVLYKEIFAPGSLARRQAMTRAWRTAPPPVKLTV